MKRLPGLTPVLSILLLVTILSQPLGRAGHVYAAEDEVPSVPIEPVEPQPDPLFDALFNCIANGEPSVIYESPTLLSDGYTRTLMIALLENYPAFFYLDHISMVYVTSQNPDGSFRTVYTFSPVYTLPKDEIMAAKAHWQILLDEILSIVTPEMTDLEKALVLHDYLCTHFSYDSSLTISDSYSFLTEKTGVCEAYADTYSALLTLLGIPNTFAHSDDMNHVWNVVQIDGEWYHVDVTWDDPLNTAQQDQPGRVLHTHFLRSDNAMRALGYTNWICDVSCTSDLYDNSFLAELTSAVTTDGNLFYGVSNAQKSILRCDLRTMSAEPIIDLSDYRWYVWEHSSYWDACFANVYCDGEWLYYSTPTAVKAYDLASEESLTVYDYEENRGYFYAMRYEDHQLICTLSRKPAASEDEFRIMTRHRYRQASVDGMFITSTCTDCDESKYSIAPPEGETFAVFATTRPAAYTEGAHDIRIAFAVDPNELSLLGQIEYTVSLELTDGSVQTLTFYSEGENFDAFQSYYQLSAGEKVYTTDSGFELLGFYLSGIEDTCWINIGFEIKQSAAQSTLYSGTLDRAQLLPPSEEITQEIV